jgi:tetratricopeptide (TPR) repeat protein
MFLGIVGCEPTSKKDPPPPVGNSKGTGPTKGGTAKPAKPNSLRAQQLLSAGKVDEAWDECQRVFLETPEDARALLVAGTVLHLRGKLEAALQVVDRIDLNHPEYGQQAAKQAASWCWEARELLSACSRCEKILERYPNDADVISLLAANYDLQGRRYEASKWNQQLIRLGKFNIMTLVLAIDTVKPLEGDAMAAKLAERRPNDPLVKSLPAFGLIYSQQPELAEAQFREMLQQPGLPAACYVGLGVSLIDQEKFDEIPAWLTQVPIAQAERLPSYWRVLGLYYKHLKAYDESIYCLTRSAELDPFDYLALGPLSQSLTALKDEDRANQASVLFERNQLTNRNVNYIRDGFRKSEWMLQIADALDNCGRGIEAAAWRELCELSNDKNQTTIDRLQAQRRQLASLPDAGKFVSKTSFGWNTDSLKPPSVDQLVALGKSSANSPKSAQNVSLSNIAANAKLAFVDRARDLGVDFQYNNGDDPNIAGMQTYQSNGGGASVIDFDNDGWPDLFALQAGGDPREQKGNGPCGLFRNQSGVHFVDVAAHAHVTNGMYGQGAAVGDWDQDGFSDLLILNFGENRLLKNMGDGTFAQVEIPAMKRDIKNAPNWSVSGAIADINGDHLPDIVEVNYSSGIDVITHLCFSPEREVQVCRPTEFPASKDFLYVSDGQGGFHAINDQWSLPLDDGRGLGIVVGNLDQMHGNDIYIANDMSANHLLVSYPASGSHKFVLREEAVRRGCAVDMYGKPQASMGVGCADVDHNGTLDLFMTNFFNEYNALYLQNANGGFDDASRRYKLVDANKNTLGFGTQLVDLDLDGWHDAIIVNGHVEDYSKTGKPYKMRPQILMQRNATLVEQPNESLGEFFMIACLGRGLGLFDFNRDGKVDFYATHLDAPLAIVENRTVTQGSWLAIDLVGTESERDAIGATVTISSGDQRWLHQRLAGNGFECTNERSVLFGLGGVPSIDHMEIRWPSGKSQTWENVSVNQRILAIEGQTDLVHKF